MSETFMSRGLTTSYPYLANSAPLRSRRSGQAGAAKVTALVRRTCDLAGSLLLVLLTLVPILLVACLIKLESSGPVLYRQDRVGRHGRVFSLLKLRSMRNDAEVGGPRWAAERDPRITRVGRFIRSCRLDEVPQLINVIRGEMSLVGPRPERPCFVQRFGQLIPRYDERISVLPGITGWAQVNYKYTASMEDTRVKLLYDLYYITNRSLLLDLRILIATVPVVLFRQGAR